MRHALTLVVPVLFSCACITHYYPIPMRYDPVSETRPLELSRKPKIYVEPTDDRVGSAVTLGNPAYVGNFTPPFPESIQQALAVELGRLGISAVRSRQQADAILSSIVTQANFANVSCSLLIALTLRAPDGRLIFENTLAGSGRVRGHGFRKVVNAGWQAALNDAMSRLGSIFEPTAVTDNIFAGSPAAVAVAPGPAKPATAVRSDVDELPQFQAAARPNAYAVVVGIQGYRNELPQADFADADAKLFTQYLTRVMGFQATNVATLLNEQATKSAVEKYLEGWLPNRIEKDAEIVVYFSGHGAPNPVTGDAYWVPFDGDPSYLQLTAYPLKRLYAELAKLPAKKVTVVMDSCFSGAGGRSVLAKGAKPLVTVKAAEAVPPRLSVLSASAGDQISHSYQQKGHGLFTYFLLKAIKEKPDGIGWRAAFDAAASAVAGVARKDFNADQVPQWSGR